MCAAPMPRMTVFNAKHRGGATEGVKGGWDLGPKWMEETSDGVGGVAAVEWSQLQRYASFLALHFKSANQKQVSDRI